MAKNHTHKPKRSIVKPPIPCWTLVNKRAVHQTKEASNGCFNPQQDSKNARGLRFVLCHEPPSYPKTHWKSSPPSRGPSQHRRQRCLRPEKSPSPFKQSDLFYPWSLEVTVHTTFDKRVTGSLNHHKKKWQNRRIARSISFHSIHPTKNRMILL